MSNAPSINRQAQATGEQQELFEDLLQFGPVFYAVAIPAVFLVGLSKGGLGGGLGMLGTPLLALIVSPVQAAAILLPVLLLMDAISLYSYRGIVDWKIIRTMVPAAGIGIGLGWATASLVSDDWIRIIVGAIALLFAVNQITKDLLKRHASTPNPIAAGFWGAFAGFTSFIAHAGGPPYQAYTLPLKMEKMLFAGTSVIFFAAINSLKILPYFLLGQFSTENLYTSASLLPVAIIGVLTGVALVKRISQAFFYQFTYVVMLIVGTKLVWDGRVALSNLV